ncbi:unnamed protein product [Tilletia laevis]|uniref:WD repeat-containing protein JIP5 n=2 Tax=Tilletia TaxID=13289 RepID=A0A177VGI5_9BASI|nr:hypothetical protein CF336_g720 [Tilletia laevis]KAE8265230.1 hypothetical protein A4X03_0g396 [Tilletia caries]KAE8208533.1 hypothetical protein CF335_g350 [Tilletia laevis]CAD6889180.1 unnamed protein product [Tilletia caries]CAD6904000.1 unnamed protein product [Tilletia laevis]
MDIPLTSDALDIAFHPDPQTNIIAAGLLSGKIQLIDYTAASTNTFKKTLTLRPTIKSTRALAFADSTLYAASKDRALFGVDTHTGTLVSHWANVHAAPPSRMITLDSGLIVTGDDDGAVKLWDPRMPTTSASSSSSASTSEAPAAKKTKLSAAAGNVVNSIQPTTATPVRTYAHHFDWISDLLWCDHLAQPRTQNLPQKGKKKATAAAADQQQQDQPVTLRSRLVCTSGDGTLSVIDFRQGGSGSAGAGAKADVGKKAGNVKGVEVSEDQEDELLAIAPVKGGSKFVVGTQLGTLSVWAPTRAMLDHVDRIPGHPASVDAICPLYDPSSSSSAENDVVARFAQDDDVLLTGSSDGLIRILHIGPPHTLLGVLADHGGSGMPVERIRRKGRWVVSIGHESAIKWSDLAELLDGDSEDEDEEGEGESSGVAGKKKKRAVKGDDDSDDDEDEDEDEEEDEEDSDDDDDAPDAPLSKAADDEDEDSDSDSDSDAAPAPTSGPKTKAAQLAKGIAKGALLAPVTSTSSGWDDDDDDEERSGKKGRKGGVKKEMKGRDQAAAKRNERVAFFADL